MADSQALMAIHLSFLSKGSDDSSPSLVTLGWKPSKWKDAFMTPVFGGDQGGWLPLQPSLGFPTGLWALASNRGAGRRQGEPRIKGDPPQSCPLLGVGADTTFPEPGWGDTLWAP